MDGFRTKVRGICGLRGAFFMGLLALLLLIALWDNTMNGSPGEYSAHILLGNGTVRWVGYAMLFLVSVGTLIAWGNSSKILTIALFTESLLIPILARRYLPDGQMLYWLCPIGIGFALTYSFYKTQRPSSVDGRFRRRRRSPAASDA